MLKSAIQIVLFALFSITSAVHSQSTKHNIQLLNAMKIFVSKEDNRSISFTNTEAAYFFTQSHTTNHPEYSWFEGLNIAQNRIFGGYQLYEGSQELSSANSQVWVYPYKLLREYTNGTTEELWMFDNKNILEIELANTHQAISIALKGKNIHCHSIKNNVAFFSSMEGPSIIAVSSKRPNPIQVKDQIISTSAYASGFYIAVGKTRDEAASLIREIRKRGTTFKQQRINRIAHFLLHNVYTSSNIDSLNRALNWIETTTNQLITKQKGEGIYAGLPWFNEYWGRDEFISLPGATLVSGQFETARKILKSFAQYQQTDKDSKYFGRVPNILKPNDIDYHTTDATPHFVIKLQEYVKYSGDTSLIRELYPSVINSIEGALKYWVDDKGYLLHEDNETWMDARDEKHVSYSPRSTRANDIQALWYNQLLAGAYFARYMHDSGNLHKWEKIANRVKNNFEKDYRDATHDYLADRLTDKNLPDFTLRPNQLFALDMVSDTIFRYKTIQRIWNELVYPWGVATLDQHNAFFHPYHLSKNYPKDEAYHNGTIWPWLNGIAMQRMIESEQPETAYTLFKNMNREALTRGVVGGLGENLDAYPHQIQSWPKATGAYLQAWSNAEHLRIWYQYFLGIRPDLTNSTLMIAPRIPNEIESLNYGFIVGHSYITASYRSRLSKTYVYKFNNTKIQAIIDIFPFEIQKIAIYPRSTLLIKQTSDSLLISIVNRDGKIVRNVKVQTSFSRLKDHNLSNSILQNVKFAHPIDLNNHQTTQIHTQYE